MKGFIEVQTKYGDIKSLNVQYILSIRPLGNNHCIITASNKDDTTTRESYEEIKRKIEEAQK